MAGATSPHHSFPHGLLERKLDELALQLQHDVEPGLFLRQWLTTTVHAVRANDAEIWLRRADHLWSKLSLSVEMNSGTPCSTTADQPPAELFEAAKRPGPQVLRQLIAGNSVACVVQQIRQAGQPVGLLVANWDEAFFQAEQSLLMPYMSASAELTEDLLVQQELRQLRQEHRESLNWDQFLTTANACVSLQELADHITHDGRVLLGGDRVSVVSVSGASRRVLSVSGVDQLDARSGMIRQFERLVRDHDRLQILTWQVGTEPPEHIVNLVAETPALQSLGLIPLGTTRTGLAGMVIVEYFEAPPDQEVCTRRCHWLQHVTTAPWVALSELELSTWSRWQRSWFRRGWPRRFRTGITLAAVLVICLLLAVVPAELQITATGVLLPAERREIFAQTSGVISEVLVHHGDDVAVGELMLVIHDPAVEIELTRVQGEIATTQARLGALQAARISPQSTSIDQVLQSQQLAAEEAELRQKLQSLGLQQTLLEDQRTLSRVTSPIAGQILTWETITQLQGRPVERGQVLLSVGNVTGPWMIEARVRERDIADLRAAQKQHGDLLKVDVASVLDMARHVQGTVREFARVTEVDEHGEKTVRVTIDLHAPLSADFHPGATVLPRIHCGRHSMAYIWTRDLWHAARKQWMLWW